MSYDNLSSVSQNVLKFYQQLTGEERRVPFIFGRNNHNVLVMEIGWTDVLTVILVILSIKFTKLFWLILTELLFYI